MAAIGLSTFGFLIGLFRIDMAAVEPAFRATPRRGSGIFLVAVTSLFALMWLGMILPAVPGDLPAGRIVYDIASPVHLLDLSLILPLLVVAGIRSIRGRTGGPVLAAILLCKIATLGLALLSMATFAGTVGSAESILWILLLAAAAVWIVVGERTLGSVPVGWLRPSLW